MALGSLGKLMVQLWNVFAPIGLSEAAAREAHVSELIFYKLTENDLAGPLEEA
jgi:hypothetical protein